MPTLLETQVIGAAEVVVHLKTYGKHIDDWSALWPEVTAAFVAREKLWFGTKGSSGGAPGWPALTEQYAEWKAVVYPGKPILVREGDLKRSLTEPDRAKIYESDREILLGSDISYARYHQTGTKNMKARPPLIPTIRMKAAIARIANIWVGYDKVVGRALTSRGGNMRAADWAGTYVPDD